MIVSPDMAAEGNFCLVITKDAYRMYGTDVHKILSMTSSTFNVENLTTGDKYKRNKSNCLVCTTQQTATHVLKADEKRHKAMLRAQEAADGEYLATLSELRNPKPAR